MTDVATGTLPPTPGKKKEGTGVVIGRFQVPTLHAGHHHIIAHANRHERCVVVVGSGPFLGTKREPLDFLTRQRMINNVYPNAVVQSLGDHPSDEEWSNRLDETLRTISPTGSITLYGSRDSFIPHYKGSNLTKEVEQVEFSSGTEVRQQTFYDIRDTEDFRRGAIYSANIRSVPSLLAIDVAMWRSKPETPARKEILIAKAKIRPNEWKIPGRMVSRDSNCIETEINKVAAEFDLGLTTTVEATNKPTLNPALAILPIRDWKYGADAPTVWTGLYLVPVVYGSGRPSARSKYRESMWLPLGDELPPGMIPEHHQLFSLIMESARK